MRGYRAFSAEVLGFANTVHLRSLESSEVRGVVDHVLGEGCWYGDFATIEMLARLGVAQSDKEKLEDLDFTILVAREVWYRTLCNLATSTRAISKLTGHPASIRARRYRFADLATPGLLFFIHRDMSLADAEGFADDILESRVSEVAFGDQVIGAPERAEFLRENRDTVLSQYFDMVGLEKNLMTRLLVPFCRTAAEKFYVAFQLLHTLDWSQYWKLLQQFNVQVEKLARQSNQFGGISVGNRVKLLETGMPTFPEFAAKRPSRSIEISAALFLDSQMGRSSGVGGRQTRRKLQEAHKQAVRSTPTGMLDEASDGDKEKLAAVMAPLLSAFCKELPRGRRFEASLASEYWDLWCAHMTREIDSGLEKFRAELRNSMTPDCRVLVEGPSDQACYQRFLELLIDGPTIVSVEECGGTAGVCRRLKDLLLKDRFVGGVVTVFDADATRHHQDALRLGKERDNTESFKYDFGTLEDLFPWSRHCSVMQALYGDVGDLAPPSEGKLAQNHLGKFIWEKGLGEFNKNEYAKTVALEIRARSEIPSTALRICERAIELGDRAARAHPQRRTPMTRNAASLQIVRMLTKDLQ